MADAAAAARDRIDQALILLERRLNELKAAPAPPDDDLFAMPAPPSAARPDDQRRIAELEAAGREASRALAEAAAAIRLTLAEAED